MATSILIDSTDPRVQDRTPFMDLSIGGQNGAMPDPANWVSGSGYVPQKLIAVLLEAPSLMQYMPGGNKNIATLKALIELQPIMIDGLKAGLEVEMGEAIVGHAGEMMQSPTKTSRPRSEPSFTWKEKYGMAVAWFWHEYIRYLMLDPDLQAANIVAVPEYKGEPIVGNAQAFTTLFLEPDPTFRNVTNAWISFNMMPQGTGEINGKREMAGAGEIPDVNITFSAYTRTGNAVKRFAKNYLQSLQLTDLRPNDLKLQTEYMGQGAGPMANVTNAASGYKEEIANSVINPAAAGGGGP